MNSKSRTAVFPGSFDPFHLGHVDVAKRTLQLFDQLIIAVVRNPSKKALFSVEQRMELLKEYFKLEPRVKIDSFEGLLVDYLKASACRVVVRGLRAISDYDYETQMALLNRNLLPDMETIFLVAKEEHSYVSSSLIKQIAPLGADVSKLVPEIVAAALRKI